MRTRDKSRRTLKGMLLRPSDTVELIRLVVQRQRQEHIVLLLDSLKQIVGWRIVLPEAIGLLPGP